MYGPTREWPSQIASRCATQRTYVLELSSGLNSEFSDDESFARGTLVFVDRHRRSHLKVICH